MYENIRIDALIFKVRHYLKQITIHSSLLLIGIACSFGANANYSLTSKVYFKNTNTSFFDDYNLINNNLEKGSIAPTIQDSITIRGIVYDTHEPPKTLTGVTVRVKDKAISTSTDVDGKFSIDLIKGDILLFSMAGYEEIEYFISKADANLNISLPDQYEALDEVVITGMTEQQKRHIASSTASVNVQSNLGGKPITSLSQSLQGGVTGLQVSQNSGLPGGDAATIKIRGLSTLGFSDPLVLVDGVPMDMNDIDPLTVESITVLKDAAAAAVYGSKAANGVIVIATKRGAPGKVAITYDGYFGVQNPTYLSKLVDAPTFMELHSLAQSNDDIAPTYSEMDIENTRLGNDPVRYPDTDWLNLILNKNAALTNHSLSVSGGNDLARFAVSGSYLNQQGMLPSSGIGRFNIRANTTVSLSDNFIMKLDVLAIKKDRTSPYLEDGGNGNKMLENMHLIPPTIIPKFPDDVPGMEDLALYGIYNHGVTNRNPLAWKEKGGYRNSESGQTNINFQPQWTVLPNLNLRSQLNYRLTTDVSRTFRDNTNFFDYYTGQMVETWTMQRGNSQSRSTYYYLSASADYTLRLNDHYLFVLGGYSQEKSNSNAWETHSVSSAYTKLNYSYNNKLLLELSARIDGSSRFGPGNKFGFFPSIALGYNLEKESFFKEISALNNFKIRGSYGRLGNENIGLYMYQTLINSSNGEELVHGNPNITWETVNMLDLGFDLGLFSNNKIEVVFDYYDKYTKNIILSPRTSPIGGMGQSGSVYINAGEVSNKGVELSINYFDRLNKNLSLSFRPGITYNINNVEKLYREDITTAGGSTSLATITTVGYPLRSIHGYLTDGLLSDEDFDSQGESILPTIPGAVVGDIKYRDLNEDGKIDGKDMHYLGDPNPKIHYFSNFGVTYKNIDFELLFQGTGRSDLYLFQQWGQPINIGAPGSAVPTTHYAENAWRPGKTDALYPRISAFPDWNSSDYWIRNGAYLRVKYIQLGYTLRSVNLKNYGVKGIRLYLNAQNPFTKSDQNLIDPESRGSIWTHSIMKTYSFGLNVKF